MRVISEREVGIINARVASNETRLGDWIQELQRKVMELEDQIEQLKGGK